MAVAISDANLMEIYAMSNEDKLDLVDLIIQSMRSAASKIKTKTVAPATSRADQFNGKWIDSKSSDAVPDLHSCFHGSWGEDISAEEYCSQLREGISAPKEVGAW